MHDMIRLIARQHLANLHETQKRYALYILSGRRYESMSANVVIVAVIVVAVVAVILALKNRNR